MRRSSAAVVLHVLITIVVHSIPASSDDHRPQIPQVTVDDGRLASPFKHEQEQKQHRDESSVESRRAAGDVETELLFRGTRRPVNDSDDRFRAPPVESRAVCDCGVQQYVPHRIYGGHEAFPNEYPWMAALVFPPGTVSCGGSLISHRFALTAAHCFLTSPSSLFVVLGGHDLRFIGTPDGGGGGGGSAMAVPARQIVVHPKFDRASGDYDVAIIEFAVDVIFGPNVSPICLPFPNVDINWHPVVVTGWGLTQFASASFTLQEVTLTAVPNEVCQAQYTLSSPLTERMVCAWGNGKDACRGDSGGPLTWNYQGRWYVVGLVSFGMECGTSNAAGVYTRVESFLEWIQSETDNTACLSPAGTPPSAPSLNQYPWLIGRSSTTAAAGPSSTTLTTSTRVTGALG